MTWRTRQKTQFRGLGPNSQQGIYLQGTLEGGVSKGAEHKGFKSREIPRQKLSLHSYFGFHCQQKEDGEVTKSMGFVSMVSVLASSFEIAFCSRVEGKAIPVFQSVIGNTERLKISL